MNLDLVLGMSCNNIGSLACDQNSGLVAHTASGVLVLLNTKTNCQVKYLHVRKNCVSSASFSQDGRYVTTGETGYRPAVRVWRIKDGLEVATLCGHEFGIKCVQFCPTMTEIVSVGLEHDNVVNVWSWPEGHRVAANNIVDVIRAVTYSECGSFFVTAGCRHIKFWYPKLTRAQFKKTDQAITPLYGRLGILGDCKEHTFIDVACGNGSSVGSVYAITRAGGLVLVSAGDRQLKEHKNIEGVKGTCIKVHDRLLFIGFNNGDTHMFNAITLAHLGALPVPTFLRRTGLNGGGVFTLTFNLCTSNLTTAYKNSSMCVWDMQDAGNVKQKYVAVYHSAAIANFDFFSSPDPPGTATRETLVTVSHDSTVRLWGVLIDKAMCYDRLSIFYTDEGGSSAIRPEKHGHRTLSHSGAVTAVKVSPDRKYVVTGNKAGTICVYDKDSYAYKCSVKAHSREVTCLAFYHSMSAGHLVLVSGSRDRLIKVMDATNEFRLVNTLNIHSSSITALKVCQIGAMVKIAACAADRSVTLSEARLDHLLSPSSAQPPCSHPTQGRPHSPRANKPLGFQLYTCSAYVSTPTDIVVDPHTHEMAVGFQDGNIRVLELSQLQERRIFPGCTNTTDAQVNKVELDSCGVLLLSAASDKTINIISFYNGHILHVVTGHNKMVTGLVFTSKDDHVISTSMDGCVFLWRLTSDLIAKRREILASNKHSCAVYAALPSTPSPQMAASQAGKSTSRHDRYYEALNSPRTARRHNVSSVPMDAAGAVTRPSSAPTHGGGGGGGGAATSKDKACSVFDRHFGPPGYRGAPSPSLASIKSAPVCGDGHKKSTSSYKMVASKKKVAEDTVSRSRSVSCSSDAKAQWSRKNSEDGTVTNSQNKSVRSRRKKHLEITESLTVKQRSRSLSLSGNKERSAEERVALGLMHVRGSGGRRNDRPPCSREDGRDATDVSGDTRRKSRTPTRGEMFSSETLPNICRSCLPVCAQQLTTKQKVTKSRCRSSPPRPHRHTWRSLVNMKRTEDVQISKRRLTKTQSI